MSNVLKLSEMLKTSNHIDPKHEQKSRAFNIVNAVRPEVIISMHLENMLKCYGPEVFNKGLEYFKLDQLDIEPTEDINPFGDLTIDEFAGELV